MIYLDNAATTKVSKECANLAFNVMTEDFGNPSAIHKKGFEAEQVVKDARENIAKIFSCEPGEIFFTSGGTEANNIAILGGARANKRLGNHIITTQFEHSSVLNAMKQLEKEGFEITYLPSDKNGFLRLDMFANAVESDTCLVSIMAVNNETGTIQPIEEIGNLLTWKNGRALFHVDAVQAVGKLPFNIKRTRIDLISASAHKFHAPKGCGLLYRKNGTKLESLVYGGGQEGGLRSGTENVPGIAAMSLALKSANDKVEENFEKMSDLRKYFIEGLLKIDGTTINGFESAPQASPYIVNASFKDVRGEVLVHALEEEGIYVGTGSACSSHSKGKSDTLTAMGLDKSSIESAVRFSFCAENTVDELDKTLETLNKLVGKLSKFKRK